MADLLTMHFRETSWVRTIVASLARFCSLTGQPDLERVLAEAREDSRQAEASLLQLASQLVGYSDSQVAALAIGPKVWFRLNGVPVAWRPLPSNSALFPPIPAGIDRDVDETTRVVLLALIGSGLRRSELLRLHLGDLGSLDSHARVIPDLDAEPLAVRYTALAGRRGEYITLLTFPAREALRQYVAARRARGELLTAEAPFIARRDGSPASDASISRAIRLSSSLIRTVSDVNLELCTTTGEFFRAWGMPGSRFAGQEEFIPEDFT
jgi:integrase